MPQLVSTTTMIRRLSGMLDTRDLSEWEQQFVRSLVEKLDVAKVAVEPDHPDYAKLMGVPPKAPGGGTSGAPAQAAANDGGPAFPVSTMVEERTAGYGHQDGPATYR